MRELENKIALVVGAGTDGDGVGLGRATAIIFAREGAMWCAPTCPSSQPSEPPR